VQARIPAALSTVHNFISIHNPHDQPISSTTSDAVQMYDDVDEDIILAGAPKLDNADLCWDRIAQKMWDDYILVCEEQGIDRDAVIESDSEGDDDDDD